MSGFRESIHVSAKKKKFQECHTIHEAAKSGNVSRVNLFLNEDPNLVNAIDNGWTPLHRAAKEGRAEVVRLLLEKGAKVDCRTETHQWTPLLLSVKRNHHDTVDVLLKWGADTTLSTQSHNRTPQMIAEYNHNKKISRMLRGSSFSEPRDQLQQPIWFNMLHNTWMEYFNFLEGEDKRVKIAILDTGIDQTREDLGMGRKGWGPGPLERIKSTKNFATLRQDANDIQDLNGHGTQVAGIILLLAPQAEVYIARVCDGKVAGEIEEGDTLTGVSPENVEKAIEWAIEQEVDIINMSFGFKKRVPRVENALFKAQRHNILTFAAMSNVSNYEGAAWPARDTSVAIGVHSCHSKAKKPSEFTPEAIPNCPNFMVVGEQIKFRSPFDDSEKEIYGTSFATPIAVAIAALILGFTNQVLCAPHKQRLESEIGILDLRTMRGMTQLLMRIGSRIGNQSDSYTLISPHLFWKDWRPSSRNTEHAWEEISHALAR